MEDVHYELWLLMTPEYCDRWLKGEPYENLMKEYKQIKP